MDKQKVFIQKILSKKNVVEGIRTNLDTLLKVIPEIRPMIGFEHKHPHHHLDVWEHTLCALSFSPNNFDIRLAILLHDIGKPHSYQEEDDIRHFNNHPKVSSDMARLILKRLEFEDDYIQEICQIIELHDEPLTKEFISSNVELSKKIFEVQKCDILAHNPEYNQKRLAYISDTQRIFDCKNIDLTEEL